MGRPRQYTPAKLKKAAEAWFKSITRIVRVTEEVDSGKRDEKGHAIYTSAEVLNQNGEPVEQLEYIVPPTVGGLCRELGISRSTWANYCDAKLNPEYEAATTWVRERLLEWNERELLTRPGKDVKGILFNLQNNYDYTDKREVELGERASKAIRCSTMAEKLALLRELTEDDDEDADGSGC